VASIGKFLGSIFRWIASLFDGHTSREPIRDLDLQITSRTRSITTLQWGCAHAFAVSPEVAVPLVVVSDLYRSPRANLEDRG
jgi:hypothetical protein